MVEQETSIRLIRIRLIRISGFVKLTSLELGIRISLLRPHPDHPHVVPDHVGVHGREPVHLPHLPHALFALKVRLYPANFLSLLR
jgi:hypothetical protein